MNKKIILAVMFALVGTQSVVAMQANLSSMLSSVKNIKNPTLVAGAALAAATTLVVSANYFWTKMSHALSEKKLRDQQEENKKTFNALSSSCDAQFLMEVISARVQKRNPNYPSLDSLNTKTSREVIKSKIEAFSKKLKEDENCSAQVKEQCEQIDEILNNDEDDYVSTSRHLQLIDQCSWYKGSQYKKEDNQKTNVAVALLEKFDSTEEAQAEFAFHKKASIRKNKAQLWSWMKFGYSYSLALILYGLYKSRAA